MTLRIQANVNAVSGELNGLDTVNIYIDYR